MCGITGYLSDDPRARAALPAMTAALAHRGPDADGFHFDGPVGLGHRRLSVIDIAGSRQPLVSIDDGVAVVFNGEIYNFRALRRELAAAGHVFRTNGDGEVLVHGWKAWGPRMLDRIAGMFAFALWDRERRELFLARDHLGVKPLYYAWHDGALAFGSELKALRPFPGLPHTIDLDALALYLECQYIPAPRSIYRAIRKLPAGHWLSVRDGALTTGEFWRPRYVPKHAGPQSVVLEQLDARLASSVESMLVADVPLGAFVSGGVDSGVIAALATRISGRALDTFNLGFTGSDVGSEHEEAARVARHIGSRHHCLMLAPDDVLPALDRWVDVFDEPFGDQGALPTMLLAQFSRREVTVVLTGEGADEVFGGYSNYTKRLREERLTRVLAARARRSRGSPAGFPGSAATGSSRRRANRAHAATRRSRTFSTRCCAASSSPRRSPQPRTRASPIMPKPSTMPAITRVPTDCSTSTPGFGCRTTFWPRSTARRWRFRWKRGCRISITSSMAGARAFIPSSRCKAASASASSKCSPSATCRATSCTGKSKHS
jgi:asparagine synthase (glutamine-hydrolysing)